MANFTEHEMQEMDKEINKERLEKVSRYVAFRLLEQKPKTQVIEVVDKLHSFRLGIIKWFGRWRRYAFFPEPETVFDTRCLNDIQSYITKLR